MSAPQEQGQQTVERAGTTEKAIKRLNKATRTIRQAPAGEKECRIQSEAYGYAKAAECDDGVLATGRRALMAAAREANVSDDVAGALIDAGYQAATQLAVGPRKVERAGIAELYTAFKEESRLRHLFGRNLLSLEVTYLEPPPYEIEHGERRYEHRSSVPESDLTRLRIWLERELATRTTVADLCDVVSAIADENAYHPVREYLDRISWDGVPRLERFFTDYIPVAIEVDDKELQPKLKQLYAVLAQKWFVSAVARAFQPGSKVDEMLILEGPQGLLKSTAFAKLGGSWFSDMHCDITSRDTLLALRKYWIVEHAELESITRREAGEVKAFLSRREDVFRRPYGRETTVQPRSNIFVGSVNDRQYLRDTTGNRRYWIAPVEGTINVEAIERDRDQLWAEAVVAYRHGEKWWLDREQEKLMAVVRGDRELEFPFEETLKKRIAKEAEAAVSKGHKDGRESLRITSSNESFFSTDALLGFLKPQTVDQRTLNQIAAAMTKLGWRKQQRRIDGQKMRVWTKPLATPNVEEVMKTEEREWVSANS